MPEPTPVPVPVPVPPPAPGVKITVPWAWVLNWILVIAVSFMAGRGLPGCTGPLPIPTPTPIPVPVPVPTPTPVPPAPSPTSSFFRLGASYPKSLAETYASAWETGATQLAAGIGVDQALTTVGSTWQNLRTDAFNKALAPAFEAVAPGGKLDQTSRDNLVRAWRDLAAGLRAGTVPAPPGGTGPA